MGSVTLQSDVQALLDWAAKRGKRQRPIELFAGAMAAVSQAIGTTGEDHDRRMAMAVLLLMQLAERIGVQLELMLPENLVMLPTQFRGWDYYGYLAGTVAMLAGRERRAENWQALGWLIELLVALIPVERRQHAMAAAMRRMEG